MGSKRFIRSSKPNWPSSFLPQNHQEEVESSTVKAAEKSPPKAKVATPGRGGGPPATAHDVVVASLNFQVDKVKTRPMAITETYLSSESPSEIHIKTNQEAPSEVLTCSNSFQQNAERISSSLIWNPHESAIYVFHLSVSSCKFCITHHPPSAIIISNPWPGPMNNTHPPSINALRCDMS